MADGRLVLVLIIAARLLVSSHGQGHEFFLRGDPIAIGSNVLITDIGEGVNALVCQTDQVNCCNSRYGVKRGEWRQPNGELVGLRKDGGDLYITRDYRRVLLHRRNNAMGPLGGYCCEVDTVADLYLTTCINIVGEIAPPAETPLTVTLTSSGGSQTAGENYTLTCQASGGGAGTPTYQWRRDETALTTPTPPERLSLSPLSQADSGSYTCVVSIGSNTMTSNAVTLSVEAPDISVTVSGTPTNPTEDRVYTLTCTVSGHQALMAAVTYRWSSSNTLPGPHDAETLVFNPVDRNDNGTYFCRATVISSLLELQVIDQDSISIQVSVLAPLAPVLNSRIPQARSVRISWFQLFSGGRADSYTLQYTGSVRGCNGVPQLQGGPFNIDGSMRSFEITDLEENSDISGTLTATNIRGSATASFSATTLTARPGVIQSLRSTAITSSSITVTWDELSCVERNGEVLSYRIEFGTAAFDEVLINFGTSFTATRLSSETAYMFRVAANSRSSFGPFSSTLIVTTLSAVTVVTLPVITTEPESVLEVAVATSFTLSVEAVGLQLAYLWQRTDGVPLTDNPRVTGARASSLMVREAELSDSGSYVCVVSNSAGAVHSSEATIIIISLPIIAFEPEDMLDVPVGSTISLSMEAMGQRLTFSWQRDDGLSLSGNPRVEGAETSSLSIREAEVGDSGSYFCEVSNLAGTVNSRVAIVQVINPPVILTEPESVLEVESGSSITLSVEVTGLRLSFAWQRTDGRSLAGDPRISGADTSNLTIREVAVEDSGEYLCEITNAAGSVRSKEATISIIESEIVNEVESVSIDVNITSARVSWVTTNPGQGELYELQYFPTLFPHYVTSINTTSTFQELAGLIPILRYNFQVRVCSSEGKGRWVSKIVSLDRKIPAVRDIKLSVASSTSAVLSWTPPPDPLPGWNISYYYITYRALDTKQDNRLITTFTDTVKDGRTSEMMSAEKLLVDVEGVVHEFEVVAVLKIEGLEGIGEVKGETAKINVSLATDEALFQVMLGPVPYCVDWESGKSDSIQDTLHKALQEGIRTHCNCSLERNPISRGIFSCRGSKNVVTYRSTVRSLNSTETLSYIQDWVSSNVTILHDWYLVDIFSSCPTKVAKLDEPECASSALFSYHTDPNQL